MNTLTELGERVIEVEKQRDQYKAERDTLIDDIAVVRANNKRLEEELKRRREEEGNLEAKLSAQLSMKRDLEKENKHLKERINKAEELIKGNIETLKMYGGIISKNYELEKENKEYLKTMKLQAERISRLERENERLFYSLNEMTEHDKGMCELADKLRVENKALRLQSNTYFDEWQNVKNLYTTLTNHIRLKAKNNPGVSRYIDLVNYIDRLERD
ncbi:hypothetical protein [Staphylococcus shinii]|uniref:hypothetical protein n=1 Tax=Staphylococcus shinii TaxID=2912228 RepID=UPI003F542CDA